MENRFGWKDLFLFGLIGLLIVLVVLGWKQYDRQWQVIQELHSTINQHTGDLTIIRRMLERGGGPTTGPSTFANNDVDYRERKIHQNPDYAPGGKLIDVYGEIPDKLTALINTDLYSQFIQSYVLDQLIDRDPVTLEYIPRLATSWKISPDGLTFDFTMRDGVQFSNGDPLTADDVIFTFALIRNEELEAPQLRSYLDKLDKVEKVGSNSVRFTFKEPYFRVLDTIGSTTIISKNFYSKYTPKQINESTGLLLGSGPYRMPDPTSWKPEPGQPITIVRNERYWGEPPGPDSLTWRNIKLPAARLTALRNGDIDVYYQTSPEQFDQIKADKKLNDRLNLFEMETLTTGYYYIGWNEKRGGKPTAFADPRVRRAMTMLIDRGKLVKDIMRNYATVATGPFSPKGKQSDPTIKPWPYDPAQAEKLLVEAGFHRDGSILYGPDGKPFSFEFMYNADRPVSKQVSTYLKDTMAAAGIEVKLNANEWSTILQRTKEKDFDSVFMGWGATVLDDPNQIFTTSAIQGVGDNFVQYSNPKLDEAVEIARKTVDENAGIPLWHMVHQILHEDQPYTFMFVDHELDAVDKRIKGVEETNVGIMTLKQEWYIPAASRKKE